MPRIRPAQRKDSAAVADIYNDAVLNSVATFDTEPKTADDRERWLAGHDARHPVLVAEIDGLVVGWASLSAYSDRPAYCDTAEISLYISEEFRGRGIGRRLIEALMLEGRKAGLHVVVARIAAGNDVSVRLHESVGFHHVGIMKEVGRKFGRLVDVYVMQKIYD